MFCLQLQSRLAYLVSTSRYIPLAVFLNLANNETKKATSTTMWKYPEADSQIGKPELQKCMKAALCKDSSIINRGYFLINQ